MTFNVKTSFELIKGKQEQKIIFDVLAHYCYIVKLIYIDIYRIK